ncbi:MAG: hypothetical protein ACOC3H_01925 [bacterium]
MKALFPVVLVVVAALAALRVAVGAMTVVAATSDERAALTELARRATALGAGPAGAGEAAPLTHPNKPKVVVVRVRLAGDARRGDGASVIAGEVRFYRGAVVGMRICGRE